MPHANRVTQEELLERYEVVKSLIDKGYSGADVWRHVQEDTDWNISRANCYKYYKECENQFSIEATNISRSAMVVKQYRRLEAMFKRNQGSNDKMALSALQELNHLFKLDAPDTNMNWKQEMKDAGLDPERAQDAYNRLVQYGVADDDTLEEATHEQATQ